VATKREEKYDPKNLKEKQGTPDGNNVSP